MKAKIFAFAITLFLIISFSCQKESELNGAKVVFKAESNNYTIKSAPATTSISFTQALIGISEVELEGETEYENEQEDVEYEYSYELEFEGPFAVDLINATSTPEILISNIEPARYNEFECEISNVLDDGNSIFIAGSVELDGENLTFIFESQEDYELEIEGHNLFNQPINASELWVIVLDLDYLFGGIDFMDAQVDENDQIRINKTSNSDLYAQIKSKLVHSFDFDDDNHDD